MATTEIHISNERRELVDRARQTWIRKLIDVSRRNNLLYFRPLKTGTLDLTNAEPSALAALLVGEAVASNRLLGDKTDDSLAACFRDIMRRALENAEEKGLQTLFLTLGMATWPAEDGGRPTEAPVLLLPVEIESKGQGRRSFSLKRCGSPQINLVLLHVLDVQFGIQMDAEDLISRVLGDDEGEPFNLDPLFTEIRNRASDVANFAIKRCAVLGNFAFQKLAMVNDLKERADELATHDVIAAIAGDTGARTAVSTQAAAVDPKEIDRTAPDNEFIVLDADSSQQCAIAGVSGRGQDAVVHGPPGTGKSQTIANMIATLAATGRRVLFVAEKRAALDVVLRRLREVGLGHLAIDLHGADLSPKKVMQDVAGTLDMVRAATPVSADELHNQFEDRRRRLNAHVQRMHAQREPTGQSVYAMQGALLRLSRAVTSETRWRGAELMRLTPQTAAQIRNLLLDASGFESLFLRADPSPWTPANLPTGEAVERVLDLIGRMSGGTLPQFSAALESVLRESRLRLPTSIAALKELCRLLTGIQGTLSQYSPQIYEQDLASLVVDLAPARGGVVACAWAFCTKTPFRRARSKAIELRLTRNASAHELFAELSQAASQLAAWKALANASAAATAPRAYQPQRQTIEAFLRDLSLLAPVFPERDFDQLSIADVTALIAGLAGDPATPHRIPMLRQIEKGLTDAGADKLIGEIRTRKATAPTWPFMFDYAWFASTIDAASQKEPELRGFVGSTHGRYVSDFTRLDEERIRIAADRVRRAHGERAVAAMNANPAQEHLIRAEAAKTRRHLPLRKMFSQAADVLTAVCPCWMASPLSVSQLLDGGKQYFDFVIFDEASQVLPEDAIPSILRGKRVVVAGDNKQLPPTTFFAASDEEEYAADEDAGASEGFESLLDMMIPFVQQFYLDWHYRSRDESLINFSNHYIYGDRLVTFPGAGGPPVINQILVRQESGVDGQEDSSSAEVRRVVELVIEQARTNPRQTLGVITMGIKHMYRVQAALDRELEKHPDVAAFFDPSRLERFFVKNLERVQGDERDAIIISIGYGKDRAGNLPFRFGPLLSEGGRRRLNVAVTRARRRLTLVSSFSHLDMDMARIRPGSGVELLREYLLYAASNGKRLEDGQLSGDTLNDFEQDIFDTLTRQGIKLVPQLGASRFRIDMVAEHPQKPGRFVLAIECDGATYHSSYTARDRDRLRQQQLENLGWHFHRIWSTDWFMRKDEEVKRAATAFNVAVALADQADRSAVVPDNKPSNGVLRAVSTMPPNATRGPRPDISQRPSISDYSRFELVMLVGWVNSDGQLRTDDEILSEMVSVLGFSRRGVRIETAVRDAIRAWRQRA